MGKRQLNQIKLFPFDGTELVSDKTQNTVNKYIIDVFNETGNYPKIKCTSTYIAVICRKLVEVNRD